MLRLLFAYNAMLFHYFPLSSIDNTDFCIWYDYHAEDLFVIWCSKNEGKELTINLFKYLIVEK